MPDRKWFLPFLMAVVAMLILPSSSPVHLSPNIAIAQGPSPTGWLPFGAQTFGELRDSGVTTQAQSAGVAWVRFGVLWKYIEPDPPVGGLHTYQWGALDNTIDQMIAAGFYPLANVGVAPGWATDSYQAVWDHDSNPSTPPVPFTGGPLDPDDVDDFLAFVTALVERYRPGGIRSAEAGWSAGAGVREWEIYNEPDNQSMEPYCAFVSSAWGGDLNANSVPDPLEYADLLRQTYPVIKAADPVAEVVFGSPAYEQLDQGCFNTGFTAQVLGYLQTNYSQDAGYPFFDLMGFHQYDAFRNTWDGWSSASLPFNQGFLAKAAHSSGAYPAMLDVLAQFGLNDIPLIGTEVGLSSDRTGQGDEWQARHLVHSLTRALSLWPWRLRAVIVYTLRDSKWGILNTDASSTPAPSFYAYQWLTEELGAYQFDSQLGPEPASQGGTGSANIQAFRFIGPNAERKLVLWTDPGCPIRIVLPWNQCDEVVERVVLGPQQLGTGWTGTLRLRVVDSTAYPTKAISFIQDGGAGDLDGFVNGSISLDVGQDPVYVSVDSAIPAVQIALDPGWNLISINVAPVDATARNVFAPLVGHLTVAQSFDGGGGRTFYPGGAQNTLTTVDALHGYWVKVTGAVTLTVPGTPLPAGTSIPLAAGWNLVSYLPDTSKPLADALTLIAGKYTAVLGYEQGARTWYAALPANMNTLGSLKPHHGYWVYMTEPANLVYPSP